MNKRRLSKTVNMHNEWEKTSCSKSKIISKTIFPAWEHAFPQKKTLFEAWERRIAEMAGLGTAFPCGPAHFNP